MIENDEVREGRGRGGGESVALVRTAVHMGLTEVVVAFHQPRSAAALLPSATHLIVLPDVRAPPLLIVPLPHIQLHSPRLVLRSSPSISAPFWQPLKAILKGIRKPSQEYDPKKHIDWFVMRPDGHFRRCWDVSLCFITIFSSVCCT